MKTLYLTVFLIFPAIAQAELQCKKFFWEYLFSMSQSYEVCLDVTPIQKSESGNEYQAVLVNRLDFSGKNYHQYFLGSNEAQVICEKFDYQKASVSVDSSKQVQVTSQGRLVYNYNDASSQQTLFSKVAEHTYSPVVQYICSNN